MNIYPTSTIMSTNIAEEAVRLEQELAMALKIGARPETVQSLESRLNQARSQQLEEEQQKDIKFVSSWSNPFLIMQYNEAKERARELERQTQIETYEAQIKVIEQIEDEGRHRGIPPFIADELAKDTVLLALAQLTGSEGYLPASKVAEKCGYPINEVKPILERLYVSKEILRYDDKIDSWAASLATRERLGLTKPL